MSTRLGTSTSIHVYHDTSITADAGERSQWLNLEGGRSTVILFFDDQETVERTIEALQVLIDFINEREATETMTACLEGEEHE